MTYNLFELTNYEKYKNNHKNIKNVFNFYFHHFLQTVKGWDSISPTDNYRCCCADIINDKKIVQHRQLSISNTESWPNLEQTFLFKF